MKIAAAYITSEPGNVSENLQGTLEMLSRLEKEQVRFVLFPELNISGYTTSEKKIMAAWKQKQKIFGQLAEFSRNSQTAFAIGFPEMQDGKLYIAQFIFEKGRIIGIHRKSHLGPTEKCTFHEGCEFPVFQVDKLAIGIQLCFETHFPEISYAQARQGANVLAMGFASPKETSAEKLERFKRFLCARAYDNSCYVLACNLAGETTNGTTIPGLAMAIDPRGNVLEETAEPGSGYCITDFGPEVLERIYQSKMAWFNRFKKNEILRQFYE